MHLNGNESLYLWHTLFRHLGMFVFYAFGSLLFYDITGSAVAVLILGTSYFSLGILSRSVFLPFLLPFKERIGVVVYMGIGLGIVAATNTVLFIVGEAPYVSLWILVLLLFVSSIGTGMYWTFSNIIKYENVGKAAHPASYGSYLAIVRIIAAMLVTILGIFLSFQDYFLVLLLPSSVFLLLSLLPLSRMDGINHAEPYKMRNSFRHISPLGILANIKVLPEFFNYAFPLFFLLSFVSLPTSVLITGAAYIVSMVLSYGIGRFVDHHDNRLTVLSTILVIIGFALFPFLTSIWSFVIVTSLLHVCVRAIHVASLSKIGVELVRSPNKIEFVSGIEISHNAGSALGTLLFLGTILLFGTLPQWFFVTGALFILPEAIYAIQSR